MKDWLKNNKLAATLGGIVLLLIFAGVASSSSAPSAQPSGYQGVSASQQQTAPVQAAQLSNDSYYVNSNGNTVHSPAYTSTGAIPAGATAQCGDGTYSFSQHHSGTCSHHGGVAQWLQ